MRIANLWRWLWGSTAPTPTLRTTVETVGTKIKSPITEQDADLANLRIAQMWVDKAECPACGKELCGGPSGGMAQNVVCSDADCGWRINTIPIGNRYRVVQILSPLPLNKTGK